MKFSQKLFKPVDAYPLNVFRILFGVILILQFYSYVKSDFIDQGIIAPRFLFTFDWFPFVHPLPAGVMKFILALTLIAPFFIAWGKFFRTAVVIYLLSFSYLLFLEESYFNNHFYFIILLCFFWLFYKPVKAAGNTKVIPYWLLFLFQIQVFIVYFYGGIAKLNTDWLIHQQPVRELLMANAKASAFPDLLKSEFAVYYITYGGLVFDLLIGFFLFNKRTFKIAAIVSIVFHITNFWIFNFGEGGEIGIFPMLMIASNVLYAEPAYLRKLFSKINLFKPTDIKKQKEKADEAKISSMFSSQRKIVLPALTVYLLLQFLVPFRHLLIPGKVDWTGQAQWFSWRMKVHVKKFEKVSFTLRRFENDEPVAVQTGQIINSMQVKMMANHADMIYKYVQYLKKDLRERLHIDKAIINAEIKVSFNGHPVQDFIDPKLDLFNITYHPFKKIDWVLPLKE